MGGGIDPREGGSLYRGSVTHKRARPKPHRLRYRVFSLLVDLDRLDELDRSLRFFSLDRFNLFSLHASDFGPHDGSSLAAFIRHRADVAGLGDRVGRIRMLCYPRMLGFTFNPLTVFYIEDAGGAVIMLVYEVHNTFGEHHFYEAVVIQPDGPEITHQLPKRFYVSPFNTLTGSYRFAMRPPADKVFTGITLSDAEGVLVTASFEGTRQSLTDPHLLQLAIAYPFMTLKVVAAIHWEALRLWLKGVPLTLGLRRPQAPVSAASDPAGRAASRRPRRPPAS
ncbi:MAG TPA: DUF1365 domain-containing protein [Devosiaceae bacterium]|jgi:hypothetical protein